jgi:hypothetical protein
MSNWDSLDPLEFERRCAATLTMLGWSAQTTKGSGDQGVDVVADKEGVRLVLQCKRYSTAVGVDAVQQVYAGQRFYDARFAAVVSNSSFTVGAKHLAAKCGVKLLNAMELAHVNSLFLPEEPRKKRVSETLDSYHLSHLRALVDGRSTSSKAHVAWPSFAECQKPIRTMPTPPVEIQVPTVAADETPREDARSDTRIEFALSIVETTLVVVALVSGSLLVSKFLIGEAVIRVVQDASFARWVGKTSGAPLGILLSAAYLFSCLHKGPNRKKFPPPTPSKGLP